MTEFERYMHLQDSYRVEKENERFERYMQMSRLIDLKDSYHDCPHVCLKCQHLVDMVNKGIWNAEDCFWGTTYDTNWCDRFADGAGLTSIDKSGNTRCYTDGTTTKDNGGGYWIITCPRFETIKDSVFYQAYISSDRWKAIRAKCLKRDGYQCQICGSAINLNVHHVTYDRLGDEEIDDIITLCARCHKKIHASNLKSKEAV